MTRRLEVAIELAKKDKVAFDAKMQDKNAKAEIEAKRLRILEADKAKKLAMKDLMDKAMEAYAEGDFVKAEAYAKHAARDRPQRGRRGHPGLQGASTERHYKQTWQRKKAKEEGFLKAMQDVDLRSDRRPRGSARRDLVPDELQGHGPRTAPDERHSRPRGPGGRWRSRRS